MPGPARPTLRCLRKDLVAGLEDPNQRREVQEGRVPRAPLHQLTHPLIRHAAETFTGEASVEARRESISGLKDPVWWKVRTGQRPRGAVYEDPHGQAWLCAAGMRYDGEGADFYASFLSAVRAHGPEPFLPTDDDRLRLALEQGEQRRRTWEREVHQAVLAAVARAVEEGAVSTPLPSLDPAAPAPAIFVVEVERAGESWDEDGDETPAGVSVQLAIKNWAQVEDLRRLQVLACAAISPNEQDWDAAPDALGVRLLATVPETRLGQIVAAAAANQQGVVSLVEPGVCTPATTAHYSPAGHIAQATVHGSALPALCGKWFVPRNDPVGLEVCQECTQIRDQLPVGTSV